MKKLILITLILINTVANAQNTPNGFSWLNGNAIYQSTNSTTDIEQNILFNAARNWMLYNNHDQLISEDVQKGQIIGTGHFNASAKNLLVFINNYSVDFKVKITCYKDKYTLFIYDITYAKSGSSQSAKPLEKTSESKAGPFNIDYLSYRLANIDQLFANCIYNDDNRKHTGVDAITDWSFLGRSYDYDIDQVTYRSYDDENVILQKTIQAGTATIKLLFHVHQNYPDNTPQNVLVTFSDGSVLNFNLPNYSSLSSSYDYKYECSLILDGNNIQTFKNKVINKYQIAGKDIMVPADLAANIKSWASGIQYLY